MDEAGSGSGALAALQAFMVGTAFGAASTAGHALLLYTGGGFLRAAGFLLALTFGATGAGIWAGDPSRAAPRPRWRWVGTSMAFVAAGAFALLFLRSNLLRDAGLGAGLGALFVLAEPAYACGALLAMLGHRRRAVAPLALTGIATGTLLAATFVIPRLIAPLVFFGAAATILVAGVVRPGREGEAGEDTDMKNDVVIITGVGSRGQAGFAIAERFLREGARVIISGRTSAVDDLARELAGAGEIVGVAADLTVDEDVNRLVAAARDRWGSLNALINVAGGLTVIKPLAETDAEELRRELSRNAETTLRVSRAALPLLRESGGSIVNFAAPAGARAVRSLGAYSAAKAAVIALTRAMALEEKVYGVRVNAVAPGLIDTEQNRSSMADPDSAKFVTREEIADVVLFLASDAANGVSGETIQVLGEGLR